MNKPNINTNINISSFLNVLNHLFSSTDFYFQSKIIEDSEVKCKNNILDFRALPLKMNIFEVVTFFSRHMFIQSTHFFSGSGYL